jgi:hypothetical protein
MSSNEITTVCLDSPFFEALSVPPTLSAPSLTLSCGLAWLRVRVFAKRASEALSPGRRESDPERIGEEQALDRRAVEIIA